MKYIHIFIFLITHDITELKVFWQDEIIKDKPFKWRRLFRQLRMRNSDTYLQYQNKNFIFWFRLTHFMYQHGNKKQKIVAKYLQLNLIRNFGVEIEFGAKIGKRFSVGHFSGIVISCNAIIGNNVHIMQNVTIGMKTIMAFNGNFYLPDRKIIIGDNVKIGAHSVILSDNLVIGDNVKIGAMSFINKDIIDNCTVFTEKNEMIIKN